MRLNTSRVEGRFKVPYENQSMEQGMVAELGNPVGTEVDWYVWDEDYFQTNKSLVVDEIYDTSSQVYGQGSVWKPAVKMPVLMLQMLRGTNIPNERGFYVVDTMRLVVAVTDVNRILPDLVPNPNPHIKDRIVANGELFFPTRVLPRGRYKNYYSVVTLDCNLVNPEEAVNFYEFLNFSE